MSRHYAGIPVVPRDVEKSVDTEEVCVLLRLWVLLFADDTIILAKNTGDLQKALDALGDYCEQWKITVNVSKTKIIILSRGKIRKKPMFRINTEMIEVVDEFVYFGTTFSCNGSFKKAIKKQISQATYSLIAKAHTLFLPIDTVIQLYDQLVLPILLYCSEIWGFSDLSAIEVTYRTFLRGIMQLNKSTTNCMLYGELGKCCISNLVKERMVNFWSRLVTSKRSKISYMVYTAIKSLHDRTDISFQSKWIGNMTSILCENGLNFVWLQQESVYCKWLKNMLRSRISDINIQNWHNEMEVNSHCVSYKFVKDNLRLEPYKL